MRYTKQERALGCEEFPVQIRDNPTCKRCNDWGMIDCYDPRHGVGHFYDFCNCSVGIEEKRIQNLEYNSTEVI